MALFRIRTKFLRTLAVRRVLSFSSKTLLRQRRPFYTLIHPLDSIGNISWEHHPVCIRESHASACENLSRTPVDELGLQVNRLQVQAEFTKAIKRQSCVHYYMNNR